MTTVKQYFSAMRTRQVIIATKLGCDISQADKPTRVLNVSLLAIIAVLLKVLVDKGIVADGEIITAFDQARDDAYDNEPYQSPAPPTPP